MATIADLKPDKANARKHSARNIGMIVDALQKVGAARSIVIDEDDVILAGNGVIEAAAEAGIERVRVVEADGNEIIAVRRSGLTDEQKRKLALWDNRASELAEWDTEVLADLDMDLGEFFFDSELKDLGIELEGKVEDLGPQIDRAAELQEKWGTCRGQIWQIGEHRIMCGDSTSAEDVGRLFGGSRAKMVWTDPPYNVSSEGRNYAADAPTQKKTYQALKEAEWDQGFDISAAFPCLELVMAGDCAVYLCTSQWLVQRVWEWMWSWSKFCGYVVWCKPNPAPCLAKRHWTWATELIAYAVRGKHVCNFPAKGHALNWWEIVSPSHSMPHPTQKPVELPEKAIAFSSERGGLVADLFLGSGTTMVAAEQLDRICYGMEISPDYTAVCLQRMADMGLEPVLTDGD